MSKPLPYFCWYPADAETDANFRAMDDADIGFYIRCLNHAWINGGIPADPKERARVLRTRTDMANKRWERVGKCFVTSKADDNFLVNPRQEVERIHAMSKSAKASESAKCRSERSANAPTRAYESGSVSEASSEFEVLKKENPVFIPKAITAPKSPATSERFEEFWQRYPVHDGKPIALGVWIGIVNAENEAAVFACLDRYLASDRGNRSPKNPNNWLHDCHRDNWESDWPRPGPQNGNGARQSRTEAIKEALKDL